MLYALFVNKCLRGQRFFSVVDKIRKQHGPHQEDSELTEEVIDSRCVPSAVTATSATNHVSKQSPMTTGPSTAVASAESTTNRPILGSSGIPSGNTPLPTLLPHFIDQTSKNTRSPIQNFTRRLISRGRASEATRNVTFPQPSW